MEYKVVMTTDAEEDLDRFIRYLLFGKQNSQAASNVLNDFEATKQTLSNMAGSLKLCDNPRLNALGYRKIHFLSHRYCVLKFTAETGRHYRDLKTEDFSVGL